MPVDATSADPFERSLAEAYGEIRTRSKIARPLSAIGLLLLVVGFVFLAVVINHQRQRAEEKAARFERLANDSARALERARSAYMTGDLRQVGASLGAAIIQTEKLAEAASLVERPGTADPAVAVSKSPAAVILEQPVVNVPKRPRNASQGVYIQFAGSLSRAKIKALNDALRDSGWRVQGSSGERTANAIGFNEVRYGTDTDRAGAESLAQSLAKARITESPVSTRQMKEIQPGVLEVWISN